VTPRDRNQKERALRLTRAAAAAVRRGHPWVYREGLVRPAALASGTPVTLADESDAPLGVGLWDERSPIAVRVFGAKGPLDERTIVARIERAFARRDGLIGPDTDAYRLCNGEGDHVPGLVIDRYTHVAVVRLDGDHLEPWIDRLVPALSRALKHRGGVRSVVLRLGRDEPGERRFRPLSGEDAPDRVIVRENGMRMEVDLAHGQKTGAFLDQRDNRARVRSLAAGRSRALNLYSYTGGFSIAAALGGAAHVTSVDVAAAAHASAQRSFRENGLDPAAHAFVTADAFAFLEAAAKRGDRFDLVISDPPSFAPNERAKPRALAAYRKLHAALVRVLAKGGVLCAASCSSHVSSEDFLGTLDEATLGEENLSIVGVFGQPADHPTLPAWPEGRYLEFVVLA
jgi:23S rRNA (cytosine1962-C5)-methyltransferase